jgi:hypothetical protein
MNSIRPLVTAALLTLTLTACSAQSRDGSTEIPEPGSSVTHEPAAPQHRDEPCRAARCPR